MAPLTSTKLTYEDYSAIPADGRRHEIVDGEHHANPSPNTKHQRVSLRIAASMFNIVSANGLGEVFCAPFDVVLTEHDVIAPDIVFVSAARAHIVTPSNIQGVPDLIIEILSSNRRYDKRIKYDIYERARVPEYWIVDPDDEVVEVFRHDGQRFVRSEAGNTLTTALLPGFGRSVRDLFL